MSKRPIVSYTCTRETFRDPGSTHPVRWLDWDADLELARRFWGPEWRASFPAIWAEARELGYTYCAVIGPEGIRARAAVWRFSEEAWELAAVYTQEAHQRQSYGAAVCAFATRAILAAGRTATCQTFADNTAMRRTAEKLGFLLAGAEGTEP